ncbi:hypothetical protein SAMN04487917_101397 [Arthrobacter sp. yr096]|uniref:hypothetical protein n=1 Tax=Arthrobacter sp. yr096 TaxID=1761750 RepID=UPI0008C4786F|nr:hypothetical protein [Arthrobacter sp. yr096]SEI45757.1 hypothetical protein SAMN04487917_101397 [Arthrobacter sp. yr096]
MTTPPPGATVASDSKIAQRIENAMGSRVSILALSDETGIPYKTLHRSIKGGIKGHRPLTVAEVGAIAFALNISSRQLVEDDAQ